MINIMKKRKVWFVFSGIMVGLSILSLIVWGLNFGIDFSGGSLMQIQFKKILPGTDEVLNTIKNSKTIENPSIQTLGVTSMILRFKNIDEATHQKILNTLKDAYPDNIEEDKFYSIGPSIGEELKRKTVIAIILAIILIIIYIAWSFRQVSKPVSSWIYGLIANIALGHDVIITIGVFSILGKFYNMEINSPFIAAILTVLGYSVNDTIVVFDRIRENISKYYKGNLEETVNDSINQTLQRSINTNLTVILVLFAILILGGDTIRDFTLALIVGVSVGTYSSIFLASPLLIVADNLIKKRKK